MVWWHVMVNGQHIVDVRAYTGREAISTAQSTWGYDHTWPKWRERPPRLRPLIASWTAERETAPEKGLTVENWRNHD
jgi:hypothetical protein